MSNWKVSKEKIQIFSHPRADKLAIGKVGSYQVVIPKGIFNDGDEVVFAPEKSILTGSIKAEFEKYLVGPDKNRVKAVRLRDQISSGIILPKELVPNFDTIEVGEDISESLGISHYIPPIPTALAGKVNRFDMPYVGSHDCEHAGVYVNELIDGERVVITEKIHGSQFILAHDVVENKTIVSSKGLLKRGLVLEDSDENAYWKASRNDDIIGKITRAFPDGVVQVFGEVVPIQDGYNYGFKDLTTRIFDIRLNGESIPYDRVPDEFKMIWVPVIYDGILNLDSKEVVLYENEELGIRKTKLEYSLPKWIQTMSESKGKGFWKRVASGRLVIRPYIDRNAKDGTKLRLKVISKFYRETGEEIN